LKRLNDKMIREAHNVLRIVTVNSWDEFAAYTQLPVVPPYSEAGYSRSEAEKLLDYLTSHGVEIMSMVQKAEDNIAKVEAEKVEYHKLKSDRVLELENKVKLKPQQQKAFERMLEEFMKWRECPQEAEYSGVIIPLKPGRGKSYIVAAFFKYLQDNNLLGTNPLMAALCLTPKQLVIKTDYTFRRLGVNLDTNQVMIMGHNALSTSKMKAWFVPRKEIFEFNERTVFDYNWTPPTVCNVDESHWFKKESSVKSRYLKAWIRQRETFWIFTSASPFTCLADTKIVSEAIAPIHLGKKLTESTFKSWIQNINRTGARLDKPNDAAAQRYREKLARVYIMPPDDPRKVKAKNHVLIFDFQTEKDRQFYFEAQARWEEAKARAGEVLSERGAAMAQFQIMRQAAEYVSVNPMADLIADNWRRGLAPVCGVSFVNTMQDINRRLVYHHKIPNDEIAKIFGDKRIIREDEILPVTDWLDLINKMSDGYEPTREERTMLRKSNDFHKSRLRANITQEEKVQRDRELMNLKLVRQTQEDRWFNNQAFQTGKRNICLFTLQSGGTGIDLDHQYESARQRIGFFSITYYAEEIYQALGRTNRAATLTDTDQYMLFPRGTILATDVAPALDKKMASLNKYAGNMDFVSMLMNLPVKVHKADEVAANFRTDADIEQEEGEVIDFDDTLDLDDDDDNGKE